MRAANSLTPYLLITISLLPALSRWLLPGLPDGVDTASHFFRAVEIDWLIGHGILYSRWQPDFVFGYGYPLFNFYGPLANYLIVALHRAGLPFIPATLATFALADLSGAFGLYLLGRDTLGKLPGVVAALAYAYSPYTLGSLHRGTLPEALVFALLPFVLWAFYHLWHEPGPRWLALSSFFLALLPLANNPGGALAAATLVAFLGALGLASPPPSAERSGKAGWGLIALTLGLALSAFFWVPLLLELRYIQIDRAYSPAILNYRHNFLSLGQLFALPKATDPDMIGGVVAAGLGLPQIGLALAGLAVIRRRTREQKTLLTAAALAVLSLACLTLPQSAKAWEAIPSLGLVQFPARLLGPASLLLALLAGSAFRSSGPSPAGRWVLQPPHESGLHPRLAPLAAAAIIVFGFGWMYAGFNRFIPAQPGILDIHAHEHRTGTVGTTTAAEFLPIWVAQKPPDESLQVQYAESPVINRLDPGGLPEGARVLSQTPSLLAQQVEIESPESFTAIFNVFYFPGWTARVDGRPVTIGPTSPAGLIAFPVPAGRHRLELHFGGTPPRSLGSLISLAGLAGLIVVALRPTLFPGKTPQGRGGESASFAPAEAGRGGGLLAVAIVGLAAFTVKTAILDRTDNAFHQDRFDGQAIRGVAHPLDATFGDELQLLGYQNENGAAVLYWRALRPLDTDWSISVTLDYAGHRVAQHDAQHPAGLPTSRWFADQYARDVHTLTPIPGAPPGVYDVRVTVYRQSDGLILQPASVKIDEWQVVRPARPAVLDPSRRLGARFGPLTLFGVDLPPEARAGEDLPVTFYWQAARTASKDYAVGLRMQSVDSGFAFATVSPPVHTFYGTSQWQPGDAWIGFARIHVPAEAPDAPFELRLTVDGQTVSAGQIRVVAPERTFTAPPMAHALDVQFGDLARLLGWEAGPGELRLYWQALKTANASYKVFVHALDEGGNILVQRDGIPANGLRATTSWLAGEVIADAYPLSLPPETTAIRAGLYDPTTGQRLRLADGGEFVTFQP